MFLQSPFLRISLSRIICSLLVTTILMAGINSRSAWGCACGCGIFDAGTSAMLPTHEGGVTFLEYDFMDQNKNWSDTGADSNHPDSGYQRVFLSPGVEFDAVDW